jgi:hypothetical protein
MIFNLTNEQLVIIDKALQQLPYYVSATLIQEINRQIIEQNKDQLSKFENAEITK